LGFLDFLKRLFRPKENILNEMLEAVDDEIEWLKKRGSGKRVLLYSGQKRHEVAGKYYYAFKLDEELRGLSDDTPIELTVGRDSFKGSLVSITPNEILIAVDQDLGERVESATLLSQSVFILEALRKRLSESNRLNRRLANEVLNGTIRPVKSQAARLPSAPKDTFQGNAVEKASQQSVSYIWGPPGTGKTWTIALLTYSLFQSGARILIVSNTNVAVDRALQMINEVLPGQEITRLGNASWDLPQNVVNPDRDENVKSVEEWRIVGTTLAKSFLDSRLKSLEFDAVIVDEASMAQIPSVYHSAMFSRQNVVVVGDFEQLPPIAMNRKSKAVQRWLMQDIFEQVGIASNPQAFLNQGKLFMLRRQYRMHPQISALINQLVYGGLLEDAAEVSSASYRAKIEPSPESALVLIDTTALNPWCKKSWTSSSKYNIYHAFVAVVLAEKILDQGREPAIITPYADQALRIRLIVRDKRLDERIRVSTVHRFQGQEVDTVIYDISDSEGTVPRWLESAESKRLMNVAFSRAQRKLIVIANREFLIKKLPSENIARKAISYIEKNGRVVSGEQFLPPHFKVKDTLAKALRPEEHEILKESQVAAFTERTFYSAFMSDLQDAKQEVLIFSPFITQRRLSILVDDLKGLIDRGVKVGVYTRPPDRMFDVAEEQLDDNLIRGASESINYLKRIGVSVNIRPEMHEKIAVIDLRTWWVGSLNILSHAHTHETMIRFQGLEKTIQNLIDDILERRPKKKEIRTTRISQLGDGMRGLAVEGSIIAVSPPRKVTGGKRVAEAFLTDGTGTIKLVLWEDQIKLVRQGMTVRVENSYVSFFRGSLQLNLGKYGRIVSKRIASSPNCKTGN